MTEERSRNVNEADQHQSDHERKVAEYEEAAGERMREGATVDEGRRPASGEDRTADRTPGDEDVVGDDLSSQGQNSDRLPQ